MPREDSFYELLLNIRGHKELNECLKEFFQVFLSHFFVCFSVRRHFVSVFPCDALWLVGSTSDSDEDAVMSTGAGVEWRQSVLL